MTVKIRRCNTTADTPAVLVEDFKSMPHCSNLDVSRESVDGWDPLSCSGPHRTALYLTGYALIGTRRDADVWVLRFTVDGTDRTVFYAYNRKECLYAYDYQPASEKTLAFAVKKAREWARDDEREKLTTMFPWLDLSGDAAETIDWFGTERAGKHRAHSGREWVRQLCLGKTPRKRIADGQTVLVAPELLLHVEVPRHVYDRANVVELDENLRPIEKPAEPDADDRPRCPVCRSLIEQDGTQGDPSWIHAEDGDWGDHTAEGPDIDVSSPASRQHYIDTGSYLLDGEAESVDDDKQLCDQCEDDVYTLSSDGKCDGCVEEEAQAAAPAAPDRYAFHGDVMAAHIFNPPADWPNLNAPSPSQMSDLVDEFDPSDDEADSDLRSLFQYAWALGWITGPGEPFIVLDRDGSHAFEAAIGDELHGPKVLTRWEDRDDLYDRDDNGKAVTGADSFAPVLKYAIGKLNETLDALDAHDRFSRRLAAVIENDYEQAIFDSLIERALTRAGLTADLGAGEPVGIGVPG